jgi:16S rRNA A1518/A1519 N6-dimethyltransferase RsmA/KsgA/DIM1 with predicted DNA glycosylase/AP lyase activity
LNDFLKLDIPQHFEGQIAVIGNFPYNISSQILFRSLIITSFIPEMTGMFQKEVAERTAAVPRTKDYGILSVMVQAYYDVNIFLRYMKMSLIPTKGKVRSYKSCQKSKRRTGRKRSFV